ncbi:hypothetical protein ACTFIZ_003803 [Dictyostelium cf. discoideum]
MVAVVVFKYLNKVDKTSNSDADSSSISSSNNCSTPSATGNFSIQHNQQHNQLSKRQQTDKPYWHYHTFISHNSIKATLTAIGSVCAAVDSVLFVQLVYVQKGSCKSSIVKIKKSPQSPTYGYTQLVVITKGTILK